MSSLPARILFVDDDADTCGAMQRLLMRNGYDCCTACSCKDAIALAEHTPFDLLITDFLLPDGDGLTILQHLRQRYPLEGVLVSGADLDLDEVTTIQVQHFAACLIKPIGWTMLSDVLTELLHPSRRSALRSASVDAARAALRARALREKVRVMSNEQLSALVQAMTRHGDDLKEEIAVLSELAQARQRPAQR
jgi:DNA-binding NtrC family response regulator